MKSFEIQCVGYSIAADWYDATDDGVMLVLPGYSSNKKNYEPLVSVLVEKTGMSALVIDYTGHGESPFDLQNLTPAQNFLEVITAFDWLKENHPDKKVSVVGTSYGGFLATQLTKYRGFDKLVLRVPGIYQPQDFYSKWKNIEKKYTRDVYRKDTEALAKHPLLTRASGYKGKTLVIVHENDEQVARETTDAFIKAFDAETYLAKGFTHSFAAHLDQKDKIAEYQEYLADWLMKN